MTSNEYFHVNIINHFVYSVQFVCSFSIFHGFQGVIGTMLLFMMITEYHTHHSNEIKQPRLIGEKTEPLKAMLQTETPGRGSERWPRCSNMSLSSLRLPLHLLTNEVESSLPLHVSAMGLTLCCPPSLPHMQVHRCPVTFLHGAALSSPPLGAPSAGPHVTVSTPLTWTSRAGTPSRSTPPWGPRGRPRARRAGSGCDSCGVEGRWVVCQRKGPRTEEQELCPDQSICCPRLSRGPPVTS